jgi:hypothetical protein
MERQPADVAEYLASLTIGMIRMAREANLDTLAYVLSVAHLEARHAQGLEAEAGRLWSPALPVPAKIRVAAPV